MVDTSCQLHTNRAAVEPERPDGEGAQPACRADRDITAVGLVSQAVGTAPGRSYPARWARATGE